MEEAPARYVTKDLWSRLERAFLAAGKDPARLTADDVGPLEHFHTGGARATTDLLALAGAVKPKRVLDIGGGIGGPARYLAAQTGAPVVIAEFSGEFCRIGQFLGKLTDRAAGVAFLWADGTSLPLLSGSFDLVWMQQANMNIEDKHALFGEIERVLAPGGLYAFQEIAAGPRPGPLSLPAPWAMRQEDNFLEPPEVTCTRLIDLGLKEVAFEDVTEALAGFTRVRLDTMASDGPPALGVHLLSTGDVTETTANTLRNIESGRISFVRGVYQKQP